MRNGESYRRLNGPEGQRVSLGELLRISAERYGERPFITRAETGETLSYTEFNQLTNRVAITVYAVTVRIRRISQVQCS